VAASKEWTGDVVLYPKGKAKVLSNLEKRLPYGVRHRQTKAGLGS